VPAQSAVDPAFVLLKRPDVARGKKRFIVKKNGIDENFS
jgi:hypothetical protein